MSSLAEELDKLTNPEPFLPDTEEFGDSSWIRSQERVESEEVGLGEIRRKAGNVNDDDPRYFGRKVSRKQLKEQDDISEFCPSQVKSRPLVDSNSDDPSSDDDNDIESNEDNEPDDSDIEKSDNDSEYSEEGCSSGINQFIENAKSLKTTKIGKTLSSKDNKNTCKHQESLSSLNNDADQFNRSSKSLKSGKQNKAANNNISKNIRKRQDSTSSINNAISDTSDSDNKEDSSYLYDDSSNDDHEDDDSYSDENDYEGDELDSSAAVDEMGESMIEGNTKSGIKEETEKGKCTARQIELWDSLMKMRIKLQKGLTLSMQLPQPQSWSIFMHELSQPFTQSAGDVKRCLRNLLDQLIQLQTDLLLANSETAMLVKDMLGSSSNNKTVGDDDDEEILSDDEIINQNTEGDDKEVSDNEEDMETASEEDSEAEKESEMVRDTVNRRKRRLEDYPELISKRHRAFEKYRNDTIQKWSDRVSSKGFGAFDQSVVKQIQTILSDKPRLLTRTTLKRSSYVILGKPVTKQDNTNNAETGAQNGSAEASDAGSQSVFTPMQRSGGEYDEEIFDDDDFYHQLLRELIHHKTSSIDDPIALSRQWLEMQKLRKKKRDVDTKASKGRRIRYDVHRKLVNFMAPVTAASLTWRDEQRDDLFRSLFAS